MPPILPASSIRPRHVEVDVAPWWNPAGRESPAQLGALYATLVLRMLGAVQRPGVVGVGSGDDPARAT